ncbi:MAG: hypothetical protein ACP5P1_15065 [Acidimicrobiales bacterium]
MTLPAEGKGSFASRACLLVGVLVVGVAISACGTSATKAQAGTPSSSAETSQQPASTSSSAVSPTSSAPTTSPLDASVEVYANCSNPSVKPVKIVLSCGDFGEFLTGVTWSSWSSVSATGTGTLHYNDCNPNCAAGHFHTVSGMKFTLSAPESNSVGATVWSKLAFAEQPPDGIPVDQTLSTSPA